MNNHFQHHISNMDMKEFYKKICQLPDCPSVIVVEELEEGEILRRKMKSGRDILYLKHQSEDTMLDVLEKELLLKEAKEVSAFPFENHSLSNKAVMDWLLVATIISDLLAIRVPQIVFTQGGLENGACFAGHGLIVLADHSPYDIQASESFIVLAHELRHEWQHQYHKDWFANYPDLESIRTKKGYNLYCNHWTEIDAESFAIKLTSIVFSGVAISEKNEKLKKKYISRANEIDIPTSDSIIRLKSAFSYADE